MARNIKVTNNSNTLKPTVELTDLDTPGTIEDKVRALPANQGLNETDMWAKVDAEIATAKKLNLVRDTEAYNPDDKHGL